VARTFLAASATKASCERAFSLANHIIGLHRQNLAPSMLAVLVHIKANMSMLQSTDAGGGVDGAQMKRLEAYVHRRDDQIREDSDRMQTTPANTTFWVEN